MSYIAPHRLFATVHISLSAMPITRVGCGKRRLSIDPLFPNQIRGNSVIGSFDNLTARSGHLSFLQLPHIFPQNRHSLPMAMAPPQSKIGGSNSEPLVSRDRFSLIVNLHVAKTTMREKSRWVQNHSSPQLETLKAQLAFD